MNAFLPAIPFIHSGFEIAERFPINTGLDFTVAEIKKLPSETLPLFSAYGYNWLNAEEFTGLIVDLLAIRKQYRSVVVNPDPKTFVMLGDAAEKYATKPLDIAVARDLMHGFHRMLYGVIIVVMIMYLPGSIVSLIGSWRDRVVSKYKIEADR